MRIEKKTIFDQSPTLYFSLNVKAEILTFNVVEPAQCPSSSAGPVIPSYECDVDNQALDFWVPISA